ncbi:MAG: sugar ABC transporter permease [Clostridiales bacterium]|nr:sugar ABC transporter permease [Clostridiales bacterium]
MNKKQIYPTYFTFGTLILYVVLYVLPAVMGIGYSFTDWSAYSDQLNFVGIENFKTVFSSDYNYMKMIGNTLWFTLVTTIVKNVLGLALAVLMTKQVKLLNFHRTVIYLPCILSALIVGMIFKSVLNPKIGLLNTALRAIGLDGLCQKWLTDSKIAFNSVMAVDIWKGMGYIMTIIIAGIMAISPVYYEAAAIDGGNAWHCFRYITLPLLMPTLTVTTVLNVIYGLKVFDTVYSLTNGGPGYATEVLYTGVYKEFGLGRYAVGTTLSTIMFLVMLVIGYFMIRSMAANEDVEL